MKSCVICDRSWDESDIMTLAEGVDVCSFCFPSQGFTPKEFLTHLISVAVYVEEMGDVDVWWQHLRGEFTPLLQALVKEVKGG